jgi:hypothetical protein
MAEALADIILYYRGAVYSKATLGGGKKDNYAKRLYKSKRHKSKYAQEREGLGVKKGVIRYNKWSRSTL